MCGECVFVRVCGGGGGGGVDMGNTPAEISEQDYRELIGKWWVSMCGEGVCVCVCVWGGGVTWETRLGRCLSRITGSWA